MWSGLKEFSKFGFENKTFKVLKIFEVVDGDTFKCIVDLGGESVFGRTVWITVRLEEIDAPEMKGETTCEKVCAMISLLKLVEKVCGTTDASEVCTQKYIKEVFSLVGIFEGDDDPSSSIKEETFKPFEEAIVELNKKYKSAVNKMIQEDLEVSTTNFTLKTSGMDLYGRVLGKLFIDTTSSSSINSLLCSEGFVRYYKGNKCREKWCFDDLCKILSRVTKKD